MSEEVTDSPRKEAILIKEEDWSWNKTRHRRTIWLLPLWSSLDGKGAVYIAMECKPMTNHSGQSMPPRRKYHGNHPGLAIPRGGYVSGDDYIVTRVINEVNQHFGTDFSCPIDVMGDGTLEQKAMYCAKLGIPLG